MTFKDDLFLKDHGRPTVPRPEFLINLIIFDLHPHIMPQHCGWNKCIVQTLLPMVGDFTVSLCSGVPIWFVLSKVSTHSEQAISHLAYQTFRRCYKIYYLLSMVCFGVQNVCMKGIGLNQIALQIVSSLLQNLLLSYNVLYDQTNL